MIPLILLCLWNIAIIVKLNVSSRIDNSSERHERSRNRNRAVTVMLLAASITTIICLTPTVIIVFAGRLSWYNFRSGDVDSDARKRLVISVIGFFMYVNHAITFFLYYIISGRRFRTTLFKMVGSWCSQ